MHSLQELCWGMEIAVHNTVWSLFSQSRWGRETKNPTVVEMVVVKGQCRVLGERL